MKNVLFFTIYILFFAVLSSLIFSLLYMQFDEQPILALNKAIKYGAILLCAIFIVPTLKIKSLYNKQILGYLEPKSEFIHNIVKGFYLSLILLLPLLLLFNLTGIIADGCKRRLNSKIEFFKIIKCLTILTPPAVEPAEAPTKSIVVTVFSTRACQNRIFEFPGRYRKKYAAKSYREAFIT